MKKNIKFHLDAVFILYYFLNKQYDNAVCLFNSWGSDNSTIIQELIDYKIDLNPDESNIHLYIHHALVPEFIYTILYYKPHLKPITYNCIKQYISNYLLLNNIFMDERENKNLIKIKEKFSKYLKKLRNKYDFLISLYNLFTPVDGDYILRGLIGDFMIELVNREDHQCRGVQ